MLTGEPIYYTRSGRFLPGTFMTTIPTDSRKDDNYIIILDHERNAKRVCNIYASQRESSKIFFATAYIDTLNQQETKPMEVKPTPNNKPEATNAFVTTDNKLHLTKKEADAHQLELDFREWGAGRVHQDLGIGRTTLLNFLTDNKADIMKFMKRIK